MTRLHQIHDHLWCFGDSWAFGNELDFDAGEMPFAALLAHEWQIPSTNLGHQNFSMGLITRCVSMHSRQIKNNDLVLVVVPPDSRWYTQWTTIPYGQREHFLDKDHDWFTYHHQLFIFSMCEMLDKTGCAYILMHNYGLYPLSASGYVMSDHHHDHFLSQLSLTELLTGSSEDRLLPEELERLAYANPRKLFTGPYFQGCRDHPNQAGHQRIADLIKERVGS